MSEHEEFITAPKDNLTAICHRTRQHVQANPTVIDAVANKSRWHELHGISSHGFNILPAYVECSSKGKIKLPSNDLKPGLHVS
jgi:LDH2 family malate/lactate/ureidoglycolate dehydrogenase